MSSLAPTAASYSSSSRVARRWSDLSPDLLVSIFSRLNSPDLIAGVSSVCSTWRSAARDPHCRRIIDLSDWDSVVARIPVPVSFSHVLNRALGFASSSELIEEVHLPTVANGEDLILVSHRLPNLSYVSFPNHEFHHENVFSSLTNFKSLKGIAITPIFFSQLNSISTSHLTNLSELKLLPDKEHHFINYSSIVILICKFLPKLKKLEMPSLPISTRSILMLLDSLQDLEYLDISGYKNSGISTEILEKSGKLKEFVWDSGWDLGEFVECCEESHQSVGTMCQCLLEEKVMEWLTDE